MPPQGRKKDPKWSEFVDRRNPNNSKKLNCIHCGKDVQPLVERMKKHFDACKKQRRSSNCGIKC